MKTTGNAVAAPAAGKMRPVPLRALVEALSEPLRHPLDPGQRLYWPYLLGSLAIALAVGLWRHRRRPAALLRALFARRIWLHRSSLLDYQLLFAKPVIRAGLFAPTSRTPSSCS